MNKFNVLNINKSIVCGRMVKDVEFSPSQIGEGGVAKGTVAVQRKYKNKQTNEYESDFIQFVAFGKTGQYISENFQKGDFIYLEGSHKTGSYENNNGQRVYTNDLSVETCQVVERVSNGGGQQGFNQPQNNYQPQNNIPISDDDLPF